ncbi:MAG TPA: hypothetical protein VGD94_12325 [Vicinamibacterales bacterium]
MDDPRHVPRRDAVRLQERALPGTLHVLHLLADLVAEDVRRARVLLAGWITTAHFENRLEPRRNRDRPIRLRFRFRGREEDLRLRLEPDLVPLERQNLPSPHASLDCGLDDGAEVHAASGEEALAFARA